MRKAHRGYGPASAAVLAAGLLVSGCGAGGSTTGTATPKPVSTSPSAATTPAAAPSTIIPAVTRTWETFFSKKTPVAQKMTLLQNGQSMRAAVNAFARDPRMSQTTAKVTSVQPSGTYATVHYKILLNGQPALPDAVGQAVLENGAWKVSDGTLCGLLGLAVAPGKKIPGCG